MSLTTRFDNLINQYKGVFIDKARGIGATTYGINKTYEITCQALLLNSSTNQQDILNDRLQQYESAFRKHFSRR